MTVLARAAVEVRRLFTTGEFFATGGTRGQLRWGERVGKWTQIVKGVYGDGPEPASELDVALARFRATGTAPWGAVAAVLFGLDSVSLPTRTRRRWAPYLDSTTTELSGIMCVSAVQTLIDLAAELDDARWEQALESALRKRLVSLAEIAAVLPVMSASRHHGVSRMRRVLDQRPADAPPTESLLETLMVQLVRDIPELATPTRQFVVNNRYGEFVARVDLCWPDLGIFLELDGQQHKDQPKYDSRRQTRVIAATGWLCGRFTWDEVFVNPRVTARSLRELVGQAARRRAVV